MIFCNGCSKTGTHILTSLCASAGKKQIGGTLVKRKPHTKFLMKGKARIEKVFSASNNMYIHSHISYCDELEYAFARHKHLMMIRNPRALAVSWMRHRVKEDSSLKASKELLVSLIKGGMFGDPIPKFYGNFLGWIDVDNIHVVKFEDFVSRKHNLYETEEYLSLAEGSLSYDNILGAGSTFTGKYSEWEDWWCDDVQDAWQTSGGKEIDLLLEDVFSKL